jgi:hypothetical protein
VFSARTEPILKIRSGSNYLLDASQGNVRSLRIAVAVVSTLNVRFLVNGASNYSTSHKVVAAVGRAAAMPAIP